MFTLTQHVAGSRLSVLQIILMSVIFQLESVTPGRANQEHQASPGTITHDQLLSPAPAQHHTPQQCLLLNMYMYHVGARAVHGSVHFFHALCSKYSMVC